MRHCPRCHGLQRFAKRRRNKGRRVEVYIQCDICRWESILYSGSDEAVKIEQQIERLKGKASRGLPVQKLIQRRRRRLREVRRRDAAN